MRLFVGLLFRIEDHLSHVLTNEVARACDETIQVTGPRAAFSLGLRNHFFTLPSGATPLPSLRIPRCHEIEIRALASRNWKWEEVILIKRRSKWFALNFSSGGDREYELAKRVMFFIILVPVRPRTGR